MKDLINRQDAIDTISEAVHTYYTEANGGYYLAEDAIKDLKLLPPAQPEPCEDVVSRNAIVQKLNKMDRYVSEELRLCDTDKKFPKNEVFIVDDVYEEIVEKLPPAQPELIEKTAYIRGFEQGRTQGMIDSQGGEHDDKP